VSPQRSYGRSGDLASGLSWFSGENGHKDANAVENIRRIERLSERLWNEYALKEHNSLQMEGE